VFLSFVDFGNIYLLLNKGLIRILYFIEFDIIMSCCIAGPVIMMSQNRQEKKDRERAKRLYDKFEIRT
jgi:hypothetical protein